MDAILWEQKDTIVHNFLRNKPATLVVAVIVILLALHFLGFKLLKREGERTPTSADNAPPGSIHNLPVPQAVARVKAEVARKLNIEEGLVIVMTAYEKEWPNSCLGLNDSNEMCAQVNTPGYEVTLEANGKQYVYRTNQDGSAMREEK